MTKILHVVPSWVPVWKPFGAVSAASVQAGQEETLQNWPAEVKEQPRRRSTWLPTSVSQDRGPCLNFAHFLLVVWGENSHTVLKQSCPFVFIATFTIKQTFTFRVFSFGHTSARKCFLFWFLHNRRLNDLSYCLVHLICGNILWRDVCTWEAK